MDQNRLLNRQDCDRLAKRAFQLAKTEGHDARTLIRRAAEGRAVPPDCFSLIEARLRELQRDLAGHVQSVVVVQLRKGRDFETALALGLRHNGITRPECCPDLVETIRSHCSQASVVRA